MSMNTEEIPTPITDAAEFSYYEDCDLEDDGMVVASEKVRQLERELAEAKAHVLNLADALQWTLGMSPSPCRCLSFATPPHVCLAHRAINAAMAAQH